MATQPETAAAAPAESKAKTVAENMTARRIFASLDEATAYLTAQAEALSDFESFPIAAPGMDAEGNFDAALYPKGTAVMVSVLKAERKVKAIVVAPIPTTAQLLESEAGKVWVDKILQKELNHVAVRHLRDAEDVTTVVDQMPTTLDAYITSGREGGGGIMEAYDDLYKQINATLAGKLPVWQKARFTKSDLKKALESKGFALEYYSAVEDYKGESLFEKALALGIAVAKRKGLDPTIFERWAATRNDKTFTAGEDDEDEIDFDSLADVLIAAESEDAPAPTEAPVAPAEDEQPTA